MPAVAETVHAKIRKRNGTLVDFDEKRIFRALSAAFCTKEWGVPKDHPLDASQYETVERVCHEVLEKVADGIRKNYPIDVEWIQDLVELVLMRQGFYAVAKDYILYRQNRAKVREIKQEGEREIIQIKLDNGQLAPFYRSQLKQLLEDVSSDMPDSIQIPYLIQEIEGQLFHGMSRDEVLSSAILSARSAIELDPAYDRLTARLLLVKLDRQVLEEAPRFTERAGQVKAVFEKQIWTGIRAGRLTPKLAEFNLQKLSRALHPERDLAFSYLGLQTLYDRYLLHIEALRFESPQAFWMRVAMGMALNEQDKEEKAIAFYEMLSTFRYFPEHPPCSIAAPAGRSCPAAICSPCRTTWRQFLR